MSDSLCPLSGLFLVKKQTQVEGRILEGPRLRTPSGAMDGLMNSLLMFSVLSLSVLWEKELLT